MNYALLVKIKLTPITGGKNKLMQEVIKIPVNDTIKLEEMYKLIGCRVIDIKNTYACNNPVTGYVRPLTMVFDDEFLLQSIPAPNLIASILYGYGQWHHEMICGNVILCDTTEDGECVGFSEDEASELADKLGNIAAKLNEGK